MDLNELMRFARNYNKLGWAMQQQLDDIAAGNYDDLNPSAVEEISRTMRGFDDDLDAAIDEALMSREGS